MNEYKPIIETFTEEELHTELRRRKINKNADWYYVYEDENEEAEWKSDFPVFFIVNRRTYHLQHKLQETPISHLIRVPKHFVEQSPSRFRYDGMRYCGKKNSFKVAEKKLQEYGFQKLSNPLLGNDASLIHKINLSNIEVETEFCIEWHIENDLRIKLNEFIINNKWEKDCCLFDYCEICRNFAQNEGCVAYVFNITDRCANGAFLLIEVFASLPNNPYNRRGGEE